MKRWIWMLAVLAIGTSWGKTSSSVFSLLHSDGNGCTVSFQLRGFRMDSLEVEGNQYMRCEFLDALFPTSPGAPLIPYAIFTIGIPPEGDVQVSLAESQFEEITSCLLVPCAFLQKEEGFPALSYRAGPEYTQTDFFPGFLYHVNEPEWFGPLRIVQICVYPIQFAPGLRTLRVYSTFTFHIAYENPVQGENSPSSFALPNEGLYQHSILNYSTAKQFIQRPSLRSPVVAKSPSSGEWYKIPVTAEGMYRITGAFLKRNGVAISTIDPTTLKIYNNGGEMLPESLLLSRPEGLVENPIWVFDGGDGRFDESDYILFYGKGISGWTPTGNSLRHYTHLYAQANVYWLTFNDGQPGRRIGLKSGAPSSSGKPVDRFKDAVFWDRDVENPLKGGKIWYGIRFDEKNADASIELPILDPVESDTVRCRIRVKGGNEDIWITHQLQCSLNGNPLGIFQFSQANSRQIEFASVGSLRAGQNSVGLHYTATHVAAVAYLDWIEIEYTRFLKAQDGKLRFYSPFSPGIYLYILSGFSSKPVVLDITQPENVCAIEVHPEGQTWVFQDTVTSGMKTYYAVVEGNSVEPLRMEKDTPSSLRDPHHEGELLILTHRDFMPQAMRYKEFKETFDSLSVFVADIQDVYDEFSGGLPDPVAIRDFVHYAVRFWRKGPGYLLLFGDGDYDYRNLISSRDQNWIPPYEYDAATVDDARASDDWYTYVIGDDKRMDLAVGRLPVQTAEEAQWVVDKLIQYQSNPIWGDWKSLITLVADDEKAQLGTEEERDHILAMEELSNRFIAPEFNLRKIYLTEYPEEIRMRRLKPKAQEDLLNQINRGTLIVDYSGHGNRTVWAHERIFDQLTDLHRIQNGPRPPLFYAATCEFGLFDDPFDQYFAERLLVSQNGGAIAVIGATRFCYASANNRLNQEFLRFLFALPEGGARIGDALRLGKLATSGNLENNEKFVLLGDPSMRLAIPKYELVFTSMEPETLKALALVSVQGEIRKAGSPWEDFQGKVEVRAFDSKKFVSYIPKSGIKLDYVLPGNDLFRGQADVQDGRFHFQFIVPKDLSYGGTLGRLSGYFWNDMTDGFGYKDSLCTGGSVVMEDTLGPEIALGFVGYEMLQPGAMVSGDLVLLAKIQDDKSGINLTGEIGHTLMLWLDDQPGINVTDYFQYAPGEFLKGELRYPLGTLSEGNHRILLKVWDNANNSSTTECEFRYISSDVLVLENVLNYPNPMSHSTHFTFDINQSAEVEIKIFTVDGRLVRKLDRTFVNPGFNMIFWDGRDEAGDFLSNGVYLYKIIAKNRMSNRRLETSKIGKLMVYR